MGVDNGIPTVKQGLAMNNQVAPQKGFFNQFCQKNQIMQTGFQTVEGGGKLFKQETGKEANRTLILS